MFTGELSKLGTLGLLGKTDDGKIGAVYAKKRSGLLTDAEA